MSSLPPVSTGGSGPATATVLSSAQASQLLARLRNGENLNHLKIQTVSAASSSSTPSSSSSVRQIIAIPIQSHQQKIAVSPMKTSVGLTSSAFGPNVKVVKLATGQTRVGDPSKAKVPLTTTTLQIANTQQVVTPSKIGFTGSLPVTPLLDGSSSTRKRSDIDFDAFSDSKRRKSEKGGKGLRHFSMKVCEKVQAKGSTSYNEVADELVSELTDPRCTSPTDQQYDQKNIRRRVYDALNVLMAMNIISKEKKEIRWLGLPTNSVQEANTLEKDKDKRIERIKAKTQQLEDLILQQIAFKNLVERNKDREKVDGSPAPNSAIQLPFIVVNTSKKTVIDCSISNDKMEYLFNFDNTFEIHDDMEVLKRMGLGFGLEHGKVSAADLAKARQMVPRALEQYVTQLAEKGPGSGAGMPPMSQALNFKPEESDSDVDVS